MKNKKEKPLDVELLVHKHVKKEHAKKTRDKIRKRFKELRREKREAEEKALKESHDNLTGLPKRGIYEAKLKGEIASYKRKLKEPGIEKDSIKPVSLLVIDIDHFKKFNEDFGHLDADKALVKVAHILKDTIREADMIVRWGGEEFFVILPETNEDGAEKVAEKLRENIEEKTKGERQITVSIGAATFDPNDENSILDNIEGLELAADYVSIRAKRKGRNRVEVYEKGTEIPNRLKNLINQLKYIEEEINRLGEKAAKAERILKVVEKTGETDIIKESRNNLREIEEGSEELYKEKTAKEKAIETEQKKVA